MKILPPIEKSEAWGIFVYMILFSMKEEIH